MYFFPRKIATPCSHQSLKQGSVKTFSMVSVFVDTLCISTKFSTSFLRKTRTFCPSLLNRTRLLSSPMNVKCLRYLMSVGLYIRHNVSWKFPWRSPEIAATSPSNPKSKLNTVHPLGSSNSWIFFKKWRLQERFFLKQEGSVYLFPCISTKNFDESITWANDEIVAVSEAGQFKSEWTNFLKRITKFDYLPFPVCFLIGGLRVWLSWCVCWWCWTRTSRALLSDSYHPLGRSDTGYLLLQGKPTVYTFLSAYWRLNARYETDWTSI